MKSVIEAFDDGTELFLHVLKNNPINKSKEETLAFLFNFCNTWIVYAHEKCNQQLRDYILARLQALIREVENHGRNV